MIYQNINKKNNSKEPIIPKKGRIRIVLLVVGLIAFYFLFGNEKKADKNKNTSVEKSVADTVNVIAPQKRARFFKKKKKKVKLPRKFGKKDLKKLVELNPDILKKSTVTVSDSKYQYRVFTSVDSIITNTSKKLLKRYHPLYGAIVLLEPETGRVLSMCSYTNGNKNLESLGNTLYLKSIFPAASIFKTITAAAAIEKSGFTSISKIKTVGRNHTLYSNQLTEKIKNYRLVSFENAFAYSYNPVFGRIGIYVVGADGLNEFAQRFGFNSKIPFILKAEASKFIYPDSTFAIAEVASGFNQSTQISPLFGAMIASAVVNNGRILAPTVIDSVLKLSSKKIIYRKKAKMWRRPVAVKTSEELKRIMSAVPRYGTARKSFNFIKKSYRFKDIEYGGKTGSVDKDGLGKIDWFIGFATHKKDATQRISVAVVTVHDGNWTVHSSYIAAEVMRHYIRNRQIEIARILKLQSDTLEQKGKI